MTRLACETAPSGASARLARRVASGVPVLVTERLRLRAPLSEDFATYAEIVLGEPLEDCREVNGSSGVFTRRWSAGKTTTLDCNAWVATIE